MALPAIVYALATVSGHLSKNSQTGCGGMLSVASEDCRSGPICDLQRRGIDHVTGVSGGSRQKGDEEQTPLFRVQRL